MEVVSINESSVIVKLNRKEEICNYEINMIIKNNLENIVSFTKDKDMLIYDVKDYITIEDYIKKVSTTLYQKETNEKTDIKNRLEKYSSKIIAKIKDGLVKIEEYLLQKEKVVYDIKRMYIKEQDMDIVIKFIYYPIEDDTEEFDEKVKDVEKQIEELIEELMENIDEMKEQKKRDSFINIYNNAVDKYINSYESYDYTKDYESSSINKSINYQSQFVDNLYNEDLKKKTHKRDIESIINSEDITNQAISIVDNTNKKHNIYDQFVDKFEKMQTKIEKREDVEILKRDEDLVDSKVKKIGLLKKFLIWIFILLVVIFRKDMKMTLVSLITFISVYLLLKMLERIITNLEYMDDDYEEETLIIQNYPYLKKGLLDEKNYITKDEYYIGKSDDQDLVISNNSVSKNHAVIYKKSFGYYIKDLSSKNGTYINDERLDALTEHLLVSGDKLRFANELYQYVLE